MKRNQVIKVFLRGCAPIAMGFVLGAIACLLITLAGCKAKKEFIEVEKWQHDTTTIVDTLRITEKIIVHDSTKVDSQEARKDSTTTHVHWNYCTYDSLGNVTSSLDYNSHTQHGSQTESQSEQTSTSNSEYQKEEIASHSESSGHTGKEYVIKEVPRPFSWWQKTLMGAGGLALISLLLLIVYKFRKR